MRVVIVDTGCANLSSVQYAVERLGYRPIITSDPDQILTADKLLLPGVGSATAAMQNLADRQLIDLIKVCTQPILGICLGMQLLARHSAEGGVDTLGIIDEDVIKIPNHDLPLPHMGWNQVYPKAGNSLFRDIPNGSYFYFVHGYALPLCTATIAETNYGESFTASVQKENFYGVQFHPERSGKVGAKLLQNFLEL
ncbi:imidazole glycerol phosphate synthase subunit HisH [Orbaceae bacterium ESL0721]|nr:imidazole glycerol phosphate synthase subunit HisH [Orbaceae bacterium ESL0721]